MYAADACAAYQEQYDKQGTGYETPRRHRHYRKFRCADDHSIGGDRDNFDASEGQLSRFLDIKTVEKTLLNMYLNTGEITGTMAVIPKFFNKIRGKNNAK